MAGKKCTKEQKQARLEIVGKLLLAFYTKWEITEIANRGKVDPDSPTLDFEPFDVTYSQIEKYIAECRAEWAAQTEKDRAEIFGEHLQATRDLVRRARAAGEYPTQRAALRDLGELLQLFKIDINLLSKILIEVDKASPLDELPQEYQPDQGGQ